MPHAPAPGPGGAGDAGAAEGKGGRGVGRGEGDKDESDGATEQAKLGPLQWWDTRPECNAVTSAE